MTRKYVLMFVALTASVLQPCELSSASDFAVWAHIPGFTNNSSLGSSGNVEENTNHILDVVDRLQSINEVLDEAQTHSLNPVVIAFRYIVNSLVETTYPIFTGLSNASCLCDGNVSAIFSDIQLNINATIALHDQHLVAINTTEKILGAPIAENIISVLDQLLGCLANLSIVLEQLEPSLIEVQQLPQLPNQTMVDAIVSNATIQELNDILQEYAIIGRTVVTQINATVNRIHLMDGFLVRISTVANDEWRNLNSTLSDVNAKLRFGMQTRIYDALHPLQSSFDSNVTATTKKLQLFLQDDVAEFRWRARTTSKMLHERLVNVTHLLDDVAARIAVKSKVQQESNRVMNQTNDLLSHMAWSIALGVIKNYTRIEACYQRLENEFDKIPRLISELIANCGRREARMIQSILNAHTNGSGVKILRIIRTVLDYEAFQYSKCMSGLTPNSSLQLKQQRSGCLWKAAHFSKDIAILGSKQLLDWFEEILRDELSYAAERFQARVSLINHQARLQVANLLVSMELCTW
ncbi:uncharacterized protein LOC128724756 [Anopheles nili]|uniref:uncharacterized protein LOC128724756 n=1 Tax=Anopheles nili TaxID=185578 RepID=UPI00237BE98B|nr:uncharacterized protein LOC128724756 [Anopheles nili]